MSSPTLPPQLESKGLCSLQEEEQQKLMDEIDRLRSARVNQFISLPQLVVCGDQSSGKSSVLESITEIPFPRRANLCTSARSDEEKQRLKNFTATIESFSDLPGLIDDASVAMGVGDSGTCFARDTLSIEISGPDKPQLTIVDTPGLVHSETRGQTQADIQMVSDLVHDYMHDPRTIILAVISARNDIANQVVLHRARTADPSGERTLGIITKPDTAGSEMEDAFISLAKNEDIPLRLGWHILRNKSTEEGEVTFSERNQAEKVFFQQWPWSSIPDSETDIETLRIRLSRLLFNHIRKEIPRVRQEIVDSYEKTATELKSLGADRSTSGEQRAYLIQISQNLTERCRAAVNGNYESPFFTTDTQRTWRERRLRAIIQHENSEFAELMRTSGHFFEIVDKSSGCDNVLTSDINDSKNMSWSPVQVSREQALEWIRPFIDASRGRELAGSANPLLVRDLFQKKSQKWGVIAHSHVHNVWDRCRIFLKHALADLAPQDVTELLWKIYIDEAIQARLERAKTELEELLLDKLNAITYNHYYTQNIQKNRLRNFRKQFENVAQDVGIPRDHNSDLYILTGSFWKSVDSALETNMNNFACEEILESMKSYYKVALKTFIDNVAIIVIERGILRDLPEIFTPSLAATMPSERVSQIVEESARQKEIRKNLTERLKSLEEGKEVFERALRNHKIASPKYQENKSDFSSSDDESDVTSLVEALEMRFSAMHPQPA